MSSFTEEKECCICFETIGAKNNCTTPCGHSFCFVCMSKSLAQNNTCPCCREVLMQVTEAENDESEYDDDDDEDYDDENTDQEEEDDDGNVEGITERFMKEGYTAIDIMSLLTGRYNRKDSKYTDDYINKMVERFNDICDEVDNELEEQKMFSLEDKTKPIEQISTQSILDRIGDIAINDMSL
jgi:hypothetical protein